MITYEEWFAYEMRRRRERPFTSPTERRFEEWCVRCQTTTERCRTYDHHVERKSSGYLPVEKMILTRVKQ